VKFVWRTDVHLSDSSPASRLDNWMDTVLGKLEQVGKIARAEKAVAVIDGGDFFHIKAPSRNSHRMLQRVAKIHQGYPCPTYANIGNHDCKFSDLSYLHEQPLGVLFETGVFKRLYGRNEAFFEDTEVSVRFVGVPYHGTSYDRSRFQVRKGREDYLVVVAHVLASPSGGTMYQGEDIIAYDELKDLDADVFIFGHWHQNQGIEEIGNGKWVVNTGSLTRGALTQDNVSRIPACVVLSFGEVGIEIGERPLEVMKAKEIFNVKKKIELEKRDLVIDSFISNLQSELFEEKRESLPEAIGKLNGVPEKVRELSLYYLEKAD